MNSFRVRVGFVVSLLWMMSQLSAKDVYVDPLFGKMNNNGSAISPYKTLQEVLNSKSIQGGDRIILRRGYHGYPLVRGKHSKKVMIVAQEGHSPTVSGLHFSSASNWHVRGLFISRYNVPGNQNAPTNNTMVYMKTEDCSNNIIENCNIYTVQDASSWNKNTWTKLPRGGIATKGDRNIIRGNHIFNVSSGLRCEPGAKDNIFDKNTVEYFTKDGMHEQGTYNSWTNNFIVNSMGVNDAHADGFQSHTTGNRGTKVIGNTFIAYTKDSPYKRLNFQAIGCFDGLYYDYIFRDNLVLTPSRIGLWISGGTRCEITNNTVITLDNLFRRGRVTSIKMGLKKSGGSGKDNIVKNNVSTNYEELNVGGVVVNQGNLKISLNDARRYLTSYGTEDTHPTPGGKLDGRGSMNGPRRGRDSQAPGRPGAIKAVLIPGYGVDVDWSGSGDNNKVAGYDIFRNGKKIGRTRTGTNFFERGNMSTNDRYTVQAFDPAGNRSPHSASMAPVKSGGMQTGSPPPNQNTDPVPDPPEVITVLPPPPQGADSGASGNDTVVDLTGFRTDVQTVRLIWKAPEESRAVAEYRIVRGENDDVWKRIAVVKDGTSAILRNQSATRQQYQIRVIYKSGPQGEMSSPVFVDAFNGNSTNSSGGTSNPPPPPPPPTVDNGGAKPQAGEDMIGSLSGSRLDANTVRLAWTAPKTSRAVAEYRVVRGANENVWKRIAVVKGQTTVTLRNEPSSRQQYQIRIMFKTGPQGAMSRPVFVLPAIGSDIRINNHPTPDPRLAKSDVVRNLRGQRFGNTVALSWSAPTDGRRVLEYRIVRGANNKVWERIFVVQGKANVVLKSQPGARQQYQIRTIFTSGPEGKMSDPVFL